MREITTKNMLKIAMGALVLALMFGLFGFAHQAQAAEYTAGSLKAQSTTASSKKVVKGKINSGSKVVKSFTMPEEGYVTFTVRIPKGLGSTALRIDHHSMRYVSANVVNGSMGKGEFKSGRFSIKPGTKFRVTLELPDSIVKQSLSYSITMTSKVPDGYEQELNNSKKTANALTLNEARSGNILMKSRDWFVFKAPKDGTYKAVGKMLLPTSGTVGRASMTLYKGSTSYLPRIIVSGSGYNSLGTVKLKKGEKAYVEVTPGVLNTSASENYALKMVQA